MRRSAAQAWFLALATCLISCSEAPNDHTNQKETSVLEDSSSAQSEIDVDKVDIYVDPCEGITTSSGAQWCTCNPECCKTQQWFCTPVFGDPTYYKKDVVVDICDEDLNPCAFGHDDECPPPELVYEGECAEAYECPPMAQNLDYGWQWCEMSDGTVGQQNVSCDKGQLYTTPCQPCLPEVCDGEDNDCDGLVDEDQVPGECQNECGPGTSICVGGVLECFGPTPQEEICDGLDNDCDGEVDEAQLNVCGECGPVPSETCNAFDDDCDGQIDEDLVKMCTTACGSGVEVCQNGYWGGCTAPQPTQEICDGIDNDCNGQVDDGISCICTIQDVGKLFPCAEDPLLCGQGFKTCECVDPNCAEIITTSCFSACHWMTDPPGQDPDCDPLVGMPLAEEECNAFDDNCNGLVDEDLVSGCYTGPEGTLNVGICEPGTMVCEIGVWGGYNQSQEFVPGLCADETVPKEEECNGIDDDCDGIVDWGEEVPETDILFVVDWSGSMSGEIDAVLIALNQFSAYYGLQDKIQWGLIVGPREAPGDYQERLYMISDVAPFPDFLNSFASLGNVGMSTGNEMLLDALYLSMQNIAGLNLYDVTQLNWDWDVGESVPPKDNFKISWRPGANKVIIVFSDEEPQSYMIPEIKSDDIKQMCAAAPQLKTYAFSTQSYYDWDEIADACDGKYFPLTDDATEMYNYLMEILDEVCASPSEN